jgi:penicillin-binding protein 2
VDHPEIAIAVFVEHGQHGGSAAAPVARKAIEAYFLNKKKIPNASKPAAEPENAR